MTLWIDRRLSERSSRLSAAKVEVSKANGDAFKEAKPPGFMEDVQSDAAGTNEPIEAEAVERMAGDMSNNESASAKDRATDKEYRHQLLMKGLRKVVTTSNVQFC